MKKIYLLLCCSLSTIGFAESAKLTLEQALEMARQNSPRLKAAQLSIHAAENAVTASGRWENPQLNFEAEGVGGDLDGTESAEYSVVLKQLIRRGDKRALERQAADRAVNVAAQSRALSELGLLSEVRRAFIDVLSQQEAGRVRAEQEQLGRAFVEVAKRRYEAGGASELDVVQAELALDEILLEQTCCFGDLKAARICLASLTGMSETDLPELKGSYYELDPLKDSPLVDSHPVLRKVEAQMEMLRAKAARARADDSSDITLGAGVRHEAAADINTFVVGVSMPLNFVRSGRAAERAMLTEVEALAAERDEVHRTYQQRLSQLVAVYEGGRMEAMLVSDKLLPKANEAYELTRSGYEAGRFSWFELIAAQQHLAEIRIRHIDALRDAHIARADIEKYMNEEL